MKKRIGVSHRNTSEMNLINGSTSGLIAEAQAEDVCVRIVGLGEERSGGEMQRRLAHYFAKLLAARILEESGRVEAARKVWE